MWLLQRKNMHKKHLLWLKIISLCIFFHSIILIWLFCIYQGNYHIYAIAINKQFDYSAPILFLPHLAEQRKVKKEEKSKSKIAAKTENKKATQKTENKNTVQTKMIEQPKTTVAPAAPAKKIEPPKIKEQTKVIEPIKKKPVQPQVDTKPKAPALDKPAAIPAKPVLATALDIQQPIIPTQTIKQKTPIAPIPQALHIPDNAHISNNYREVEALRRGAQLQKELVRKWQPPIGVSPECTCEISFFVNNKGNIENLKMIKNSGVMMFDISARQALYTMKMPQWTYGKPLIISFKQ